jgi:hypothetical protein
MICSRGFRGNPGCLTRTAAHVVATALVVITMLAILWAGTAASAGVFVAQSRASASPSPGRVKFYIVPPARNGQAESLFVIAEKTLGSGSRFMEIFNLNKGRLQPRGRRLENPSVIFPGWILQLPGDASGLGVHFGRLPVVSPRPTSSASHRASQPPRQVTGGASASHFPIGWAAAAFVIVAVLAFTGLSVRLSRRRRVRGDARRAPSHARRPGSQPGGGVGPAATTPPEIRVAAPPWPAADHPSWPAGDPSWPADHPSWPAADPSWPADHPSWPAADPSWPADHPSWPGAISRPVRPLRESRPELPYDHRSQAASLSAGPLIRNPVDNWGPSGAPVASPPDRTPLWSAQFAPTAAPAAQPHHAAALSDSQVGVVLTRAPAVRSEGVTGLGARAGEMVQLAADDAAELSAPVAREATELPTAGPVRLAGRILSVADDQAAEITQQASSQAAAIRAAAEREAAEITRQASSQAAAIRAAAEQEATELRTVLMTMSGELSRVATHVTENLARPTKPATSPPARPAERPAAKPAPRRGTKPSGHPATKPADRPATKPAGQPRQYAAMRLTRRVIAALVLFAVISGSTEIALHGFSFFVFRSAGTGATPGNGLGEDQGPGQPNAPRAHRHPTGHKP